MQDSVQLKSNKKQEGGVACSPYPLLVVGDDAAHEVGVGVAERGHQLGEGLLVELPHGAEHPLLGLVGRAKGRLRDAGDLVQPHDAIHWQGQEGRAEWPRGLRGWGCRRSGSGSGSLAGQGSRSGTGDTVHKLGDQKPQTYPARECSFRRYRLKYPALSLQFYMTRKAVFCI